MTTLPSPRGGLGSPARRPLPPGGGGRSRPTCLALAAACILAARPAPADSIPAEVLDPNLRVEVALGGGISQPIGIVFLGVDDYLVLEKASGQVKRVVGGVVQGPVLDLPVNSASERGLLSMALHPGFPATPFAYIYWTESSTGSDSNVTAQVPLQGNRLDRYRWDAATGTLAFDRSLIRLRSRQTDNVPVPGQPGTNNANENGNHNGAVMAFGPDGTLYLYVGDVGRRGWMQNLPNGPFLSAPRVDDTFGGPEPDDAHLTGVILRLNDDGSTPADNPFFAAGGAIGGQAGANIQKVFAYGFRNGFAMAFDPEGGQLWEAENGDDSFSEVNRVVPGMNAGWIQVMGPLARYPQYKQIETTEFARALQQVRFPPTRLPYTSGLALSRMFALPGAVYADPLLSWKYEVAPSGAGFVTGPALGAESAGTLWLGSARSFQQVGGNGGALYRLRLTPDRLDLDLGADPRLADRVADNLFRPTKFDGTESESLVIGRGFGAVTDIRQGPDGNLYVVSITDNTIYRIRRVP